MTMAGSTINWAFDSPISADGSPHMTHICFQFDCTMAEDATTSYQDGAAIIKDIRVKVGSEELINFQQTLVCNDAAVGDQFLTPLSVMSQKAGGYATTYVPAGNKKNAVFNLCLPFGLDASRTHRFNITIETNNVDLLLNGGAALAGQALSSSTINCIAHYGTSTEATLYGSRQDFTLTQNASRSYVIFGKAGWNMLGVMQSQNATAVADVADDFSDIRLKNGAFRQLTIYDWRLINGDAWNYPLRVPSATFQATDPVYKGNQLGVIFLDLRRLTAGANAELLATASAATGSTASFFPIWVAPVGAKTPTPPKQTVSTTESTTTAVVDQSAYGN